MKILFIRSSIGFGGAEVYNLNLLQGAKDLVLDWQTIFVTNNKLFRNRLNGLGIKTILVGVSGEEIGSKKSLLRFLFRSPLFFFVYLKNLCLLRKSFDIVCLQSGTEKVMLTFWLKVLGKKIIWLEHGPVFAFKRFWLVDFFYLMNSRLADLIITVSDDAKNDLQGGGVKKEKVFAVKTGVDIDKFSPLKPKERDMARQNLGFGRADFVIGFFGAVCFEKGIRQFLETAFDLSKMKSGFKFLIVGSGPQLNLAKKLVKEKDFSLDFVFTGFQSDVSRLLGAVDLFFFPTNHLEGLSLTLMEAMALERVVLAKDIGGNSEVVVDGKSGYLYRDKDVGQLADLIIKVRGQGSKSLTMGREARKRIVNNFNSIAWVENLDEVFKKQFK